MKFKTTAKEMKNDLGTLKQEAMTATKLREHDINWSKPYHGESTSLLDGYCRYCRAWVQLSTNPLPGGIDIGGPAVAINCKKKRGGF